MKKILWAKLDPYKSLYEHMYETAIASSLLLKESAYFPVFQKMVSLTNSSEYDVINYIMFCAAIHDTGKCHEYFQARSIDAKAQIANYIGEVSALEGYRHEINSKAIQIFLKNKGFSINARNSICNAISIHHQKLATYKHQPSKNEELWIDIQCRLLESFFNKFNVVEIDIPLENQDPFYTLLAGIIIEADQTASKVFNRTNPYDSKSKEYEEYVASVYHQFLIDNNMLYNPIESKTYTELFGNDKIRPMQELIINNDIRNCKLLIINDSCGSGKTRAGLYAANQMGIGCSGYIFALPTCATTEAQENAFNDFLLKQNRQPASFLTGTAWTRGNEKFKWTDSSRHKFLTSDCICTVDQVLSVMQNAKFSNMNYAALAGKTLIIDEVHSYDAYMQEEIELLLKHAKLLDMPVVLLSATLSKEQKEKLLKIYNDRIIVNDDYPSLLTINNKNEFHQSSCEFAIKIHTVRTNLITEKELYSVVDTKINRYKGTHLIIANTVSKAEEIFCKLKIKYPQTTLFHGIMTPGEKERITRSLISLYGPNRDNRPEIGIVVATQIVEQSLDVDFDFLYTELCPIDAFLQREGRSRRHNDAGTIRENTSIPAVIEVFDNTKASELIYDEKNLHFLEKTKSLFKTNPSLSIPKDNQFYVDNVESNAYSILASNQRFQANNYLIGEFDSRQYSLYKRFKPGFVHKVAKTRYDADTYTQKIALLNKDEFVRIQNNSITKNELINIYKDRSYSNMPEKKLNDLGFTNFDNIPEINDTHEMPAIITKGPLSDYIAINVDEFGKL